MRTNKRPTAGRGAYAPRPLSGKQKPSAKQRRESLIVKDCLKLLREKYGGRWRKSHGSRYGTVMLDIVGCLKRDEDKYATYFEIEVKRPGELPTELQYEIINQVHAVGGVSGWIRSADELVQMMNTQGFYQRGTDG